MSIDVKICGLKDEASVLAAVAAGANFIGFVHYPKSSRHVSVANATQLKKLLPPTTKSVMVLVNPPDELLSEIAIEMQPDFLQLHGEEPPERLSEIRQTFPRVGIIKAISVQNFEDIKTAEIFAEVADLLLFDAKPTDKNMSHGGNGIAFDWSLLADIRIEKKWFLSGGLNAKNIREAIQKSGAKMVDVSSGVESSAGVKDIKMIEEFVKAARS